ncbi:hypothetical protein BT96DRAFT_914801 [Gymnopus androsaceus JB14]|uniref:Uncharacterized protein n=1 Tax=Gymnopus androsaceus JB14 TaxID=1447944 RepID=A0A6A4I5G5_9AGAR|nr:hypothetical protein BT96DRAFT_914801 [Gymnopus androsaceus JB14]
MNLQQLHGETNSDHNKSFLMPSGLNKVRAGGIRKVASRHRCLLCRVPPKSFAQYGLSVLMSVHR